jgi:hypothetical protein
VPQEHRARDRATLATCTGGCNREGAYETDLVDALIAGKSDDEKRRSRVEA